VEDEPWPGRPASVWTSTNIDRVMAFIQNWCLTIRIIADELNINECMVHPIVTQDLNMRKVCAKMFPKNLNDDQKIASKRSVGRNAWWLEIEPD
jgi:hypothetical protein